MSPRDRRSALPDRARRALAPIALVVLGGAALPALGAPVGHALALAGTLLSAVLLWTALPGAEDARWPALPPRSRDGARRDVTELGWAILSRDGRVSPRAAHRARALAQRRLAERGTRLGTPAAEHLLGSATARGMQALVAQRRPPTPRELEAWLTDLERLASAHPAPTIAPTMPRTDERTPR
jgi:hypothetical protein